MHHAHLMDAHVHVQVRALLTPSAPTTLRLAALRALASSLGAHGASESAYLGHDLHAHRE